MKKIYWITLAFAVLKGLLGLAYLQGLIALLEVHIEALRSGFDVAVLMRLLDRGILLVVSLMLIIGLLVQLIQKKRSFHSIVKFSILYYAIQFCLLSLPSLILSDFESFIMGSSGFEKIRYIVNTVTIAVLALTYGVYCHQFFKHQMGEQIQDVGHKKSLRLWNYGIDVLINLQLGYWLVQYPYFQDIGYQWMFPATAFCYYVILEGVFRQTLGKALTNTFVSTTKYPYIRAVLWRTLCRFIPFEPLSFLMGGRWHDTFSKTRLYRL
ncbi:RDD family protein [Spongiimicrobium salis]|uniref:hypothetical protein n=1 Tax=Spongiimicrobium salis TaxID=1667022 RepID=UPI00374D0DAE